MLGVLLLALGCSLAAGRTLSSDGVRPHGIQRRPLQDDGTAFEPCDPEDNAEDCECEVKDNEISCARVKTTDDGTSSSAAASASGSGPVSASASITITGSGGSANSSTSTPGGGTSATAEQSPSPKPSPSSPAAREVPPETETPKKPPRKEAPAAKRSRKRKPAQKPALKRPAENPEGYEDLTERCFVEPDEEEETFGRGLVSEGVKVTFLHYLGDDLYQVQTFYELPGAIGSSSLITTRLPDDVAVLCDIEPVERDDSVAHVTISHTSRYSSTSADEEEHRPSFSSKSTTTITSGGTTTTISSGPSSPSKGL